MYKYFAIAALIVCVAALLYHIARLIKLGAPEDFSQRSGNVKAAVRYSFTSAMHPANKESAYLYLPTYIAGIIYHIGTFLSLALFFVILSGIELPQWLNIPFIAILGVSVLCGTGIFIKRFSNNELRVLSNTDDYVSNALVTIFQLFTLFVLLGLPMKNIYFISAAVLLLYLPIGKLKHLVYFFAARYHLGIFYGWRGVWPLKKY